MSGAIEFAGSTKIRNISISGAALDVNDRVRPVMASDAKRSKSAWPLSSFWVVARFQGST